MTSLWNPSQTKIGHYRSSDILQQPTAISSSFYVEGISKKKCYDLHASILSYWKLQDHLCAGGELVLYSPRIVVPVAFGHRTLACLHNSHHEIEATHGRARLSSGLASILQERFKFLYHSIGIRLVS